VLANGKRCPNTSLPGSRFCGVPAHQDLAKIEAETGEYAPGTVTPNQPEPAEAAEEGAAEPSLEEAPVGDQQEEAPSEPAERQKYEEPLETLVPAPVLEDEAPEAVADPVEHSAGEAQLEETPPAA